MMVVWLAFDFVCVYAITYYNRHGILLPGYRTRVSSFFPIVSLSSSFATLSQKIRWYSFSRRHFLVSFIFRVPFVSFVGVLIEIDAGRSVLSFEKVSSSPTKDSLSPHFSSRRRRERETCARAKAITSSSSSPSSS